LLATSGKSVAEVMQAHWRRFGRSYFQRHDYEGLETGAASAMITALRDKLPTLVDTAVAGSRVTCADDFSYTDPVDGSVSTHQGIRILLADGSRIICRLSGTGTEGATLRLYVERYRTDDGQATPDVVLVPLVQETVQLLELRQRCGRDQPTVVT
jgi:phosphoglucomutase